MPPFGAIKRQDLMRYVRDLGFEGPYVGGKHQYMVKDNIRLAIANPHRGDISRDFLARILRQAGITRGEWEALSMTLPSDQVGQSRFMIRGVSHGI
jgi:predicted RNA binding protein YcfA (HicA-like mRNA interferase family)